MHCTQYGRHTAALGDESPINTPCESVRSAFSYTVSGTTSSPVILFALPFYRTSIFTHCVAVQVTYLCIGLSKARVVYHANHPTAPFLSLSPVTSVLPDHCIAPSVAGALYNPTNLQGSEAHNPGSEKKCVGAIKNVALSQQNSFDFWLKIIGSLWSDTQNNILHCGAAPVHILHVTWCDFIKRGI